MDEKTQAQLDKAARALIGMGEILHERPQYKKSNLKTGFVNQSI